MSLYEFLQSDPRQDHRLAPFLALNFLNLQDRIAASEFGAFTVYLIKNLAAPALVARTITESGAANGKGCFTLQLNAADIDTPGKLGVVITAAAGAKTFERVDLTFKVTQALFATAATGTLTASAFTSDRTDATNFHKGSMLLGLTGANAQAGGRKIDAFATAGGLFTLPTGITLPAAPANGDIFRIVNQ